MFSYRAILIVVTILSLAVAGLGSIRNSLALSLGLINLCMWSLPVYLKWKKKRDVNTTAGQEHLRVGNYPLAEESLTLALADVEQRGGSALARAGLLMSLA